MGDMEVPSPEPILDDIIAESQNHRRLTRPALEDTRMMIVRESVGGIPPRSLSEPRTIRARRHSLQTTRPQSAHVTTVLSSSPTEQTWADRAVDHHPATRPGAPKRPKGIKFAGAWGGAELH